MCKRFDPPPFYRKPTHPLYGHPPPFYLFFPAPLIPPSFWRDIFDNIAPLEYRLNTKINSCGKVISSFLEDTLLMNNVSSAYTPPFYGKPPLRTSPARFLQGNLDLSFYDFSKIPTLL